MVLTDLEAALVAAGETPAIILVAGTGSAAFGRNAGGEIGRAGGYGPPASDEGSAYDIGRRAIEAAMQQRASGEESELGKKILAQLGCAEWAEVQERARVTPDDIYPPIFPVIGGAADAGNSVAQEILVNAAQKLAALVAGVAGDLHLGDREFLLVRMGGTVGRSRFFDAQIDGALKKAVPHARDGALRVSPAEAAALVAKESDAG